MAYVFPRRDAAVRWSGGRSTMLRTDQPWDERAELVHERPDLFGPEPGVVYGRVAAGEVEQATRSPGEKRATRRKVGKKSETGPELVNNPSED